jgi:hypothetical protein
LSGARARRRRKAATAAAGPPGGRGRGGLELHAAEHAGIGVDQRVARGEEREMVVAPRRVVRRFHAQLATHAEMDAQPRAPAEAKGHLLRGRRRSHQAGADQGAAQGGDIHSAEGPRALVRQHAGHRFILCGLLPAAAEKFDFGQLGHG